MAVHIYFKPGRKITLIVVNVVIHFYSKVCPIQEFSILLKYFALFSQDVTKCKNKLSSMLKNMCLFEFLKHIASDEVLN